MALVLFVVGNISMPVFAQATTYTVTVQTNAPTYSGATPILITGVVSPAPGAGTAVVISIKNPVGALADYAEANVNAATGSFNYTSVPGGSATWTFGTYTINATWGGPGGTAFGIASFNYTAAVSSTTSSSSSTSTSTSSSSSTTSSTTSSSTTTFPSTTTTTTSTMTTSSTTTSSSTTKSSSGLGSLTYVIVAVVVIIVAALGFIMWRRSVAKKYGSQPAK